MIYEEMTDAQKTVWNAALAEVIEIASSERDAREAFSTESAESWQASCDWIRARTKALLR